MNCMACLCWSHSCVCCECVFCLGSAFGTVCSNDTLLDIVYCLWAIFSRTHPGLKVPAQWEASFLTPVQIRAGTPATSRSASASSAGTKSTPATKQTPKERKKRDEHKRPSAAAAASTSVDHDDSTTPVTVPKRAAGGGASGGGVGSSGTKSTAKSPARPAATPLFSTAAAAGTSGQQPSRHAEHKPATSRRPVFWKNIVDTHSVAVPVVFWVTHCFLLFVGRGQFCCVSDGGV